MSTSKQKPVLVPRQKKNRVARVRYPPVVVCTGLPPLVDGQIRCFLKLTIRRLRLTQADTNGFTDYTVRVKWWGEPSDGAYFKPIYGRKSSGRQITARFAVRCGPKQFSAYLLDASALPLELLAEGNNDKVLGVANVTEIVSLSMQNSVIGWYKMLSPSNHKHVADVHVNISLSELYDTYGESSGTGTGTERSQDESDDSSSKIDAGRTYKVEKNFNEDNFSKPVRNKVSFEEPQSDKDTHNPNGVASEVDRLIKRAEFLKLLISPKESTSNNLDSSVNNFDAENSELYSDTSLISDLFYKRENKSKADSSAQVSPIKSVLKPTEAFRSPSKSPVIDKRRTISPKSVKFSRTGSRRQSVPQELKTILERVKGAIVHVHTLRLSPGDYRHFVAGSIPRRSLPCTLPSKPPRPLKITFFVNAQLPTGEMCQLSRICGKLDLESNFIEFQQAEIIPLALSDSKISLWLESAAITFRVSCRHASVNRTQPMGVSVFSLEPLFLSKDFSSRQLVALSTRNPGSMMEISVELQVIDKPPYRNELEIEEFNSAEPEKPTREITSSQIEQLQQSLNKSQEPQSPKSIEKAEEKLDTHSDQGQNALVVMLFVSEVEFLDSYVKRVSDTSAVSGQLDDRSHRWEVFLNVATFSQPRRSSSQRHVYMRPTQSVSFSPKLQLYFVYGLDKSTTARFEDNHLIIELRRHVSTSEDDQLLGLCKVPLHQLYLAYGCDPIATSAVLRSPGPIVPLDMEFLPADDPFTLAPVARIRCTLAAGSADQISHYNSILSQNEMTKALRLPSQAEKETVLQPNKLLKSPSKSANIESSFELSITEIDQLYIPVDSDPGIEADVFISYKLPLLLGSSNADVETYKTPMKQYNGSSNSIAFSGKEASFSHKFESLNASNLLADLVKSFQLLHNESSTSLGIEFVISLRLYRPVVRDVIVGYAILSLTRLASLITSTKSSKHTLVRLPITPIGNNHTVGWITLKLDFRGNSVDSSAMKMTKKVSCKSNGQLLINVKRAFNLRTANRRLLGLKGSSLGFKIYFGLKTSSAISTKSECEVSDRSYCPFFRTCRFELSSKSQSNFPVDDLELQMYARDRRQGDVFVGFSTIPASIVKSLLRFQPKVSTSITLPLMDTETGLKNSDYLIDNTVGCVEFDIQTLQEPGSSQPPVPGWLQTDPKAKIIFHIDKIVVAIPVGNFLSSDENLRCRLSIGDSYGQPVSFKTTRPRSAVANDAEIVVIESADGAKPLEFSVSCPPFGEVVEFLAKTNAKVEVLFNGSNHIASISLIHLLERNSFSGRNPLTNQEVPDYHGSCVFSRISVETFQDEPTFDKDRIQSSKLNKVSHSECFVASVVVSRALHLQHPLLDREIYVQVGAVNPIQTHAVAACERPVWNFSADALIPRDLLKSGGLIFRLFTNSDSTDEEDPVVGYASVDITSLSLGIGQVSGWYHLVDAFGHCLGQILVSVQPMEDIYQPANPFQEYKIAPVILPKSPEKKEILQLPRPVSAFTSTEVQTEVIQPKADLIDVNQLSSLSQRIAQLLAQPLPPRFENVTVDEGTVTSPVEARPPVMVVDQSTEPDVSLEVVRQAEKVEKATQKSVSSSKSSKTPDPVDILFQVDQMLASQDNDSTAATTPASNFVSANVDEVLFSTPQCCHGNESEVDNSAIMSPTVLENSANNPLEDSSKSAETDESELPPPLEEVASHASTEEWSHHSVPQYEPEQTVNNDWPSLLLPEKFNSPHHSSSPMSSRVNEIEKTASPLNSPDSEQSVKQRVQERRSPPSWLTDANSKLSQALPSFFPQPDSLKAALERVRNQRSLDNWATQDESSVGDTSKSRGPRRNVPTFDIEEARRIAKIFSTNQ